MKTKIEKFMFVSIFSERKKKKPTNFTKFCELLRFVLSKLCRSKLVKNNKCYMCLGLNS